MTAFVLFPIRHGEGYDADVSGVENTNKTSPSRHACLSVIAVVKCPQVSHGVVDLQHKHMCSANKTNLTPNNNLNNNLNTKQWTAAAATLAWNHTINSTPGCVLPAASSKYREHHKANSTPILCKSYDT